MSAQEYKNIVVHLQQIEKNGKCQEAPLSSSELIMPECNNNSKFDITLEQEKKVSDYYSNITIAPCMYTKQVAD